ncbi:hypothetical protein C6P40_001389 [Pichia californica]|uniref:Uncharacterized protein n=1 Tax=Pichia californica TaxID=460514 RepID=A0A9P6WJ63_9ASCO|nr:hypothetical protein C6P42_004320 [[Candida] californica]KAG0688116.1 hypothetical protein C6P40_001389 [[Candida] californica]
MKFLSKPWKSCSEDDEDFKKYKEKYELKKLNELKCGFDIKRSFGNDSFISRSLKSVKDDAVLTIINMMNPNIKKRWDILQVFKSDWMISTRLLIEEENKNKLNKSDDNEIAKILRML